MSKPDSVSYPVVKWAAEECERQRSGEMSVWRMVEAWGRMMQASELRPAYQTVIDLGRMVEPEKNPLGLRDGKVYVGSPTTGYEEKLAPALVPTALRELLEDHGLQDRDPDEWYARFEDIHPFFDGNGRAGALLYNWLKGTVISPIHTPDWKNPVGYWSKRRLIRNLAKEAWS